MNQLIDELRASLTVVVFTGAGASADSGISTFRGNGWWSGLLGYPLMLWFGTPYGWYYTPRLAWYLYTKYFLSQILTAQPNACHNFLAQLHKEGKNIQIITQNVDGLHQKAGVPTENVAEVHGTAFKTICTLCKDDMDESLICGFCDGYPRPAATLFMESCPYREIQKAERVPEKCKGRTTILIVGLSGTVKTSDGYIVCLENIHHNLTIINPQPTSYDHLATSIIREKAGDFFEKLAVEWNKEV